MAITGQVGINVQLTDTRSGDIETGSLKTAMAQAWAVAAGVGANQADVLFSDKRTLASATGEDLDVSGALSALFGTAVFAKVKAVVIVAAAANTTSLTVSRPASNGLLLFGAASDALAAIKPGGGFAFWDPSLAGIAVTAGTADLLTITNSSGASADYYVLILGTSA
jgi:hypothetical protein